MSTCKECLHIDACGGFTPTDLDADVFDYCRKGNTTEIDMMRCQIIQLYGYGDKVAPKEIWTFTKKFVEWIQKQLIRKAG